MQCVQCCCFDNNCCFVLVVVKDGNVYLFVINFFDDKVIWCFDIFQVYCVKGWFKCIDNISQFFGVVFVYFDVEIVDVGEFFEQNGFVFYYGFGC